MPSKKPRTVEDVFLNDPTETRRKKAGEIRENIRRVHHELTTEADKVEEAINRIYGDPGDPVAAKKLRGLGHSKENRDADISRIAEIMNVSEDDFKKYEELSALSNKEHEKRIKNPGKSLWKRMVKKSPITVINRETSPKDSERPFIIFYSADWCGPCQMIKPAYLKLSPFFSKAKLYYYASDEIFKERPEIQSVPQLVAYLVNGSNVHSGCGGSAKELWDNMNLMLTLGESFAGTGELVCTETECKIEPKKEA